VDNSKGNQFLLADDHSDGEVFSTPAAVERRMMDARLLILDDDTDIGKMVQIIARSVGLEARFTTSTAEFFRSLDDWHPTHIAMDLVMPEMDGVEVLVKLAERKSDAKIIITSGVGTRVLEAAGRSANEHGLTIAGVLSKPFSPCALRALLVDSPAVDEKRDIGSPSHQHIRGESLDENDPTATELRRALDDHELQLVYQPQINCMTGRVAGFEALVRWAHPTRGIILPDRFISCAESHDLIHELTEQVLEMAVDCYATRLAGSDVTVAVNLSCRTMSGGHFTGKSHSNGDADFRFVDRITSRCQSNEIRPEHLILELTETSAMDNPVMSLALLTRLRMKGFQLSIDDFGTGYSSMLQLVRLPFSEIKVDRSFVMTATRSSESRVVVESIIRLGHSLGLRVVAEGVEDAQTMQYLREEGCDLAQGYFIARPMPAAAIAGWMDGQSQRLQTGVMQRQLI
jgi:EAL domain-containing protein (putative c-di-GMP-specific phosphodiesterase class I)/FixJ family two-component response regulator